MGPGFKNKTFLADRNLIWLARCLAVAMFIVLLSASGGAGSVKGAQITFVHRERSLQPGEVVLLKIRSSLPLKNLQMEAFGHKFPAFGGESGLVWTGLIGIDLEIKPGRYTIAVKGYGLDGNSTTARKSIKVIAKKFPARRLTVDEKFVTPPEETLARIEKERERMSTIFASVTPEKFWGGPFQIPVPGKVISAFGKRNFYNGKPRAPHSGADFEGAAGTAIRAPNAGRVVLAEDLYYSGNTIILDHGLGLYSYLAHLSEFFVKVGDQVKTGELIGKVGATGRVTGPHLHWTVRLIATRVDPLSLVSILRERE